MMTVVINGESKKFAQRSSLEELLKTLDLPDRRIAVELNKNVVRRQDWGRVKISDKDRIEIIHFVGGG